MYKFNKNFGRSIIAGDPSYLHKGEYYLNDHKITSRAVCNKNILLIHSNKHIRFNIPYEFKYICYKCLNTLSIKELEQVKHYFIVRKLKN